MIKENKYKAINKNRFKLANDLAIKLYTDKHKPVKPNEFHIEFTKNLNTMDNTILDLKHKRKFNKSLLLERSKGLLLSKNIEMHVIDKNKDTWLGTEENTKICFDGKYYYLETTA